MQIEEIFRYELYMCRKHKVDVRVVFQVNVARSR